MKKKKRSSVIGVLAMLVIGAVCGAFFGAMLTKSDLSVLGDSEVLSFAVFVLIFFAAFFMQIIIHEAGHLVFGLMTGYRFSSFRIGSLMLVKTDGAMRLKRLSLAGTGGQCLLAPPDMVNDRMPYVLYNFGGAVMNLLSAALFAVLAGVCSSAAAVVFSALSCAGVLVGLTNGIPLSLGTVNNDGHNALSLGKSQAALRAFYVQMKVNELQADGLRLRDMPNELFRMPDAELENSMVAALAVLHENRLMDEHRFSDATALIDRLSQSAAGITGLHWGLMRCDEITCALLAGEEYEQHLTKVQQKFMKQMKGYITVIRTQYAIALLGKKDPGAAEVLRLAFERAAKSYPYAADIASEREIMQLISEKA